MLRWLFSATRGGRLLLVTILVTIGLLAGLEPQRAQAQSVVLSFLCVSPWTGELSYQPNGCQAGFNEIDLTAEEVTVCHNPYTGRLTLAPPGGCPDGTDPVTLGGDEPVTLCTSLYTGAVRYSPGEACGQDEIELIVAPEGTDCLSIGDCPRPLPEVTDTTGSMTSDLVVDDPAGGQITDVNVFIDLFHGSLDDLQVFLKSPDDTVVELFAGIPCDASVDLAVTLDDEAGPMITEVSCAFSIAGTFRPEGSLAGFNGESASGSWELQVTDDTVGDAGILWDWSLEITTDQGVLPTAGCADCVVPIPGTGTGGDEGVTISELPVFVPHGSSITDLDLTVDISHTWLEDLHIHLLSPSGTRVKVFRELCGLLDDMEVIFDDEATGSFDCGNRLDFNRFRPAPDTLTAFNGESATGAWRLVVVDDFFADVGTLNNWSLEFELN